MFYDEYALNAVPRCLTAFYIYDVLLTFDVEVEFFWKGPFTGATALFLSNRYLALANLILNFFQLLPYRSDRVSLIHSKTDGTNTDRVY